LAQGKPWSRLDNAAKIFPPTSSRQDTKVFRFTCELARQVDPEALQLALDRTIKEFPLFRSVLKKGLFWHYFEESGLSPKVGEENLPVCAPIYNADRQGLLFRVSYHGPRINLEIFHALADGTGAMHFFRSMVFAYLKIRYGISANLADYDASADQKALDAFYKYYDKKDPVGKTSHLRAYQIPGEKFPDGLIGVTEGFLSASAALQKAHLHNATLSEFLVALLICSILDGMAARDQNKSIVVAVPVDLRRFFPAQTARNFFGVIKVCYCPATNGREFEQINAFVGQSLKSQLTEEHLRGVISHYSAIENNPLIKATPLIVKSPALRFAGFLADKEDSAAFSNLGRVAMPQEADEHIRMFDVFLSTKRPQLCLCTFGDTLAVSVSSPLKDSGLERRFFRRLAKMGIAVQIVSNLEQLEGEASNVAL
jgi:hypothetical protein